MADINSFIQSIKNDFDRLATLEIRTIVGPVTIDPTSGRLVPDPAAKQIVTRINLVAGDITTAIHPDFITGEYKDLRDFHAQREKEGHSIINDNIATLKSLVDFASHEIFKK